MSLWLLLVLVLCVILMVGCVYFLWGGYVRVSGYGGGVVVVVVGIGIGVLVVNVISWFKYEVGYKLIYVLWDVRDIYFYGVIYCYYNGVYYWKMEGVFYVVCLLLGIRVYIFFFKFDVIVIDGEIYYVVEGVYYYKFGDDYIVVDELKVSVFWCYIMYVLG